MILLRLLNPQGIAGLAVSIALAVLLVIQKGETHHWKKQSGQFEQLYRGEQAAFAGTVANYRAAAAQARASDKANAERISAARNAIDERTTNDYQARLGAARTLAQRLRLEAASAPADPGARGTTPVPDLSIAAGRPAQAAGQDRLSDSDALIATDQAIQLDELIKWARRQAAVPQNGGPGSTRTEVQSGK
jgi:hypothetical protein